MKIQLSLLSIFILAAHISHASSAIANDRCTTIINNKALTIDLLNGDPMGPHVIVATDASDLNGKSVDQDTDLVGKIQSVAFLGAPMGDDVDENSADLTLKMISNKVISSDVTHGQDFEETTKHTVRTAEVQALYQSIEDKYKFTVGDTLTFKCVQYTSYPASKK